MITSDTLNNKVALVTAASRGIGKAVALTFAQHGAKLVIASRNKYGDLDKLSSELKAMGAPFIAVPANMGKADDIKNLVERTLEKFGQIDILYNGAASNPVLCHFTELEEQAWDQVMNVNLKGSFLLCQRVSREMMKRKSGVIINIASVDGVSPSENLLAYSVSKAGLIMMTRGMARELGSYNIRVNAIAPGLIRTELSEALWNNPEKLAERLKPTPLQRIGEPEDIAGIALFLASDASSYITGVTILADGGRLA